MLDCNETTKETILTKSNLGKVYKSKNNNSLSFCNLFFENKNITILTPEMKISKYNKFSTPQAYDINKERNVIYFKITDDKGIQELIKNILEPLDTIMENNMTKELLFADGDVNGNVNNKIYSKIINEKNKKFYFKIRNMKLSVVDANNNINQKIINSKNIDTINNYLTYNSRVKLIFNIEQIWKSNNRHYGIRLVCNHFLILNGNTISQINQDFMKKYQITDDYDNINLDNPDEENYIDL
jgi:hypothetical protein